MVALDNTALFGMGRIPRPRVLLPVLTGAIALGAVLLVAGAILSRGFAENGFRLGSQLAWRYTGFVFFAALAVGPVLRILDRFRPGLANPHVSRKLIWGFCASYGVYLLSVFLPNVIQLSAGAALMTTFGSLVVVVMALTATPLKRLGEAPLIGEKTRRALLGTAAIYFWSCYGLMALSRISGPHRHDAFYEISLCLMLAALLLRYADRWLAFREEGRPDGLPDGLPNGLQDGQPENRTPRAALPAN